MIRLVLLILVFFIGCVPIAFRELRSTGNCKYWRTNLNVIMYQNDNPILVKLVGIGSTYLKVITIDNCKFDIGYFGVDSLTFMFSDTKYIIFRKYLRERFKPYDIWYVLGKLQRKSTFGISKNRQNAVYSYLADLKRLEDQHRKDVYYENRYMKDYHDTLKTIYNRIKIKRNYKVPNK